MGNLYAPPHTESYYCIQMIVTQQGVSNDMNVVIMKCVLATKWSLSRYNDNSLIEIHYTVCWG